MMLNSEIILLFHSFKNDAWRISIVGKHQLSNFASHPHCRKQQRTPDWVNFIMIESTSKQGLGLLNWPLLCRQNFCFNRGIYSQLILIDKLQSVWGITLCLPLLTSCCLSGRHAPHIS